VHTTHAHVAKKGERESSTVCTLTHTLTHGWARPPEVRVRVTLHVTLVLTLHVLTLHEFPQLMETAAAANAEMLARKEGSKLLKDTKPLARFPIHVSELNS
jgi:hypothetical protein